MRDCGFRARHRIRRFVWRESGLVTRELDSELRDVPELAGDIGQRPTRSGNDDATMRPPLR
jgi:hypothetical protein